MTPPFEEITLEAASKTFRVHPRTIVRALANEHNTYWSEDINHDMYKVTDIAKAYDITPAILGRVLENRDALLTPEEAAEMLKIRPRTFRRHMEKGYYKNARVKHGKIVRYIRSKIIEHSIANME